MIGREGLDVPERLTGGIRRGDVLPCRATVDRPQHRAAAAGDPSDALADGSETAQAGRRTGRVELPREGGVRPGCGAGAGEGSCERGAEDDGSREDDRRKTETSMRSHGRDPSQGWDRADRIY